MNEMMKKMFEPSEKVQKMYKAIATLVEEKRDLSTIKVSEITSRAGIGKGTAYEYFSSKEEMIIYATMWICGKQIERLLKGISAIDGFRQKFYYLLKWVRENKEYNDLTLKSMKGSFEGNCEKLKTSVPAELAEQLRNQISEQIDKLLELGFEEGIFKEQDKEKRILIFLGALMQYGLGIMSLENDGFMQMSENELQEFTYECMVKALN